MWQIFNKKRHRNFCLSHPSVGLVCPVCLSFFPSVLSCLSVYFVCPSVSLSGWSVYLVLSTVTLSVWSIFLSGLSVCLFVCFSVSMCAWPVCLSCLFVCPVCLSGLAGPSGLSACFPMSVCMSLLSVCLSVCSVRISSFLSV